MRTAPGMRVHFRKMASMVMGITWRSRAPDTQGSSAMTRCTVRGPIDLQMAASMKANGNLVTYMGWGQCNGLMAKNTRVVMNITLFMVRGPIRGPMDNCILALGAKASQSWLQFRLAALQSFSSTSLYNIKKIP